MGLGCGHTKDEKFVKNQNFLFFNEATTKKVGMVKGTNSCIRSTCFCVHIFYNFLQFFFLLVVWKGRASMHLFLWMFLNLSFFIVDNVVM